MIRYEVKKYLKNLLFVFLPALIFYIIIVLIAFLLISNSIMQMGNFLHSNITFQEGAEKELTTLAGDYFKTIDFSKFFINLFTDIHYLPNLLKGFLDFLKSNSATIAEGTEELSEEYCRNIQNMILAGLIIYLVGVFLTQILCSILLTKRCKLKTGLKRTIIKIILSSIVFAAIISLTTIFLERFEWLALLTTPILLLLNLIASLITAWACQKSAKMEFKKVVNFKNIFALLLILVFILGIYFGIHYGINYFIKNAVISSLISIPLYLYTYAFYGIAGEILVTDIRRKNV